MYSGDGCSSACHVESGYECSGEPSSCDFTCSNGVFNAGEQCDDYNRAGGDGCSSNCQIENGWECNPTFPATCTRLCGNGNIDSGEQCDDHNEVDGDGCSGYCLVENGWTCDNNKWIRVGGRMVRGSKCKTKCGDGIVVPSEE